MADNAKLQRRTAKGLLTKAISRLNDTVVENFCPDSIQTRIDGVKDALESSVEKNEAYMEACQLGQVDADDSSTQWEVAETTRANNAVAAAIPVMKQLKINAAKTNQDRMVSNKESVIRRQVTIIEDSFSNFDTLLAKEADTANLKGVEEVMAGQMRELGVALEELNLITDDSTALTTQITQLELAFNEKRRALIKLVADKDAVVKPAEKNAVLNATAPPPNTGTMNQSLENSSSVMKDSTNKGSGMLRMKVHATEPPKFNGSIYAWPTFISTWKKVIEPIT